MSFAGAQFAPNPSLVLAPESALGLHPCIALSSAPAARSVSRTANLEQQEKKKKLIFIALSDMGNIRRYTNGLTSRKPEDFWPVSP